MAEARHGVGRAVWVSVTVAAAYYLGARLGFFFTLQPTPVSTLWPPNALLLAGLLLSSTRLWPGILIATLGAHVAVQFQAGVPVPMMLCWYISNTTEALLGASLLRRFGGDPPAFDRFRYAALFVVLAAGVAPLLSTFLDAAFVQLNGFGSTTYWIVWRTRFFSNVLATLTLVPVVVVVSQSLGAIRQVTVARWIEAGVGLAVLLAACWLLFAVPRPGTGTSPSLTYAVIPLLLIAALRFGPLGVGISSLICACIAIGAAAAGRGPFVASTPLDNALSIQIFFIVAQVSLMLLAAVIAEQRRAEQRAQTYGQQLELALSSARLVSWEWDLQTGRSVRSSSLWNMLGVEEPQFDVVGRFLQCVHSEDRQVVTAAMAEALQGRPLEVEYRAILADGSVHWWMSRGRTIHDERGRTRLIGVNADTTARKHAEAELHEQRRQVAHLGRVALVAELSVALAHEMRQPLGAILANAKAGLRLLAWPQPDIPQVQSILTDIAADDERAADVITRLRALLMNDSVSKGILDVNQVVREALLIGRPDAAARHVTISTRYTSAQVPILADRVQLQQVLLNLVINSCEAMAGMPVGARRLIVSTALGDAGDVQVTVTDMGTGIPQDRLTDIFEPFVSTKPNGLGLGLSICRTIVEGHGGTLHAVNNPGGGASFRISLPLSERDLKSSAAI